MGEALDIAGFIVSLSRLQFSIDSITLLHMTLFSRFTRLFFAALLLAVTGSFAHASVAKTVLVLGDSISAAYGLTQAQGWVALTAEKIRKTQPLILVQNASLSGETSAGGAQRLPALLKTHKPSWVIIELGGNDALRGLPLSQTEANFKTMIAAAKAAKAQVLLVPMQIPPNYGPAYAKGFNGLYNKLGKAQRVGVSAFIFQSFADDLSYFQADRIHPNAAAQPLMVAAVWPAIEKLLK
jgi:acyl-CoA thioesterase I